MLVESYSGAGQTVFYGCRLASLGLLVAGHRFIYRHAARFCVAAGALMVLGTMVRIIAAQMAGDTISDEMVLVGYALSGLGYLPCLFLLYYGLARTFDLTSALAVTLIAMVCKEQGPALVSSLSVELRIWALLGILVLMMSALVAFWGTCRVVAPRDVVSVTSSREGRDLWYLVALGGMASLSVFFFNGVSQVGLAGAAVQSSATNGAILTTFGKILSLSVCVGLGYLTVIRRARRPLVVRFVPAFVALALSTALATVAALIGDALPADVVRACLLGVYDFNQYLSWALLVCVTRRSYAPATRGFTAVIGLHELLATFVGPMTVDVFSEYGSAITTVFGLVITVLAGIALPFMMMGRATWVLSASPGGAALGSGVLPGVGARTGAAGLPAAPSGADDMVTGHLEPRLASEVDELGRQSASRLIDALGERCCYVAGSHGLTERESEVLCQGQSRAAICGRLCMSEGTVKTHIAHIYEKLGVNTREALSDLVFGSAG